MSYRTYNALIARGIDSGLSQKLVSSHHSVSGLRQLSQQQLRKLGLNQRQAAAFLDSKRPPIDSQTVFELLHKCRRTCCVCRKPNQPFIIHHIIPWAESHSHDIENLVVLCLSCHSEAHTKRELAQNLTRDQLRHHKAQWQRTVESSDLESLITPRETALAGAMWDYFNQSRLLNIASNLQIDLSEIPGHNCLIGARLVLKGKQKSVTEGDTDGNSDSSFLYDAIGVQLSSGLYSFYKNLLYTLLRRIPVTVFTGLWSRTAVQSLASPGSIIACTGAYRFKRQDSMMHGPGQIRSGYLRKRGIELRFTIDAWEATSSSAHHSHLTGLWICTGILLVRSITTRKHLLSIDTTCLSIGTGFDDYQGYIPNIAFVRMEKEDEEYDQDEYDEEEYEIAEQETHPLVTP